MGRKKMNTLDWIAIILLIVGGLNWGLYAFNYNLVQALENLIKFSYLAEIIYVIVGIAALYSIYSLIKINK